MELSIQNGTELKDKITNLQSEIENLQIEMTSTKKKLEESQKINDNLLKEIYTFNQDLNGLTKRNNLKSKI